MTAEKSAGASQDVVRVLGPIRVGRQSVTQGAIANTILALLTLSAESGHAPSSVTELCYQVWRDDRHRYAFKKQVARLNEALEGRGVVLRISLADARCNLLNLGTTDRAEFVAQVRAAQRLSYRDVVDSGRIARAALLLWRGNPYTGALRASALVDDCARLRLLWTDASILAAQSALACGEVHLAVASLQSLLSLKSELGLASPIVKSLLCQCLQSMGRHAEAAQISAANTSQALGDGIINLPVARRI